MTEETKTVWCTAVSVAGFVLLIVSIMTYCYRTDRMYVENGYTKGKLPEYSCTVWVKEAK